MFEDLKTKIYEVPYSRSFDGDKASDLGYLGWMLDFSPDSIINTALRKENLMDFAMFNEGNVYNKIFFKVKSIFRN